MSWIELVAQRRPPQAPANMQPPENAKDWYRFENSTEDPDCTDVYVYSSIGGWFGAYADEFIDELKAVTTSNINIRLNSPGGSVFEGIAIANAIRTHPATVTVYVDSLAASIASVIAMAGDRLVMMPSSQIMVHNASGGCYGDASEMTKMADLLDKQSRNIAEAYAQHTGRPLAEWQDYMAAETWFTADEAVAVGLADEAVPMRTTKKDTEPAPASAAMQQSWDLSMYHYAGRDNAPAPVIPQNPTPFATGGLVVTDQTNVTIVPGELVVSAGTISNMTPDELLAMIRETVRAELAVVEGTAVGSHSTAVKDGTWDAGANEGHLPSPVPVATVRKMYTYYDEDKAEDGGVPKSACKLPHHFVSDDGTPGAASINGVRNALARLPQTQGLSDAERKTAEAHLRAHLAAYSGGDEEDHVHDSPEAVHEVTDEVTVDAEPTRPAQQTTTPVLEPQPVAHGKSAEHIPENSPPPPCGGTTTKDEADDWKDVIGFLSAPTSPSADDVFAQLKEAW